MNDQTAFNERVMLEEMMCKKRTKQPMGGVAFKTRTLIAKS